MAAASAHSLPAVTYAFAGPLNPVRSGEVKNDNPYSEWQKHPSYALYMASKLILFHDKFRAGVTGLTAHLDACKAVGDAHWNAFRTAFRAEWHHLDEHHHLEDDIVFPQLDTLYGPKAAAAQYGHGAAASPGLMDCPKMHAQHADLLARTAAVLAICSEETEKAAGAKAAKADVPQQVLGDLRAEYGGWRVVLLEHLRDEERLVVPLMNDAADQLKLPPRPAPADPAAAPANGAAAPHK